MSSSYATTYSILPVAMSGDEVTIATCEPFQTGWEREIEQITKKTVKRVVSNPLDVARYTTEFYKLAQQVRGAAKTGAAPLVSSFEQLVELGGKVQADDAHVIHIVDWLLQYAFDQRASDIHLEPRREFGVARFRIDGVLHQVYQVPGRRDGGDDQPHQAARSHGRGREAPAAGRPHQDQGRDWSERGPRGRDPPVDTADGIRREAGDADLRSGSRRAQLRRTRLHAGGSAQSGKT